MNMKTLYCILETSIQLIPHPTPPDHIGEDRFDLAEELFHPGIVQVFPGHALVEHVVDDGEEAARQFRFAGQAEFL